jgi:hypothetical protein
VIIAILVNVLIKEVCRDKCLTFSADMMIILMIILIWEGCRDTSSTFFKKGGIELVLYKCYVCVYEEMVNG